MSEVRTVTYLAMLYAFRMLGLFMVLPVLMVYGAHYQGASPFLLGIALGVYGLTQAIFQVPLGWLSDVVGRKRIIIAGLGVFALGSVIAATASTIEGLIIGRALQGSGAIASAIMAMVADLTSEKNRSKAMAAIGASIGLSFTLAMMLGPAVAAVSGLEGIFTLTAAFALLGVAIVVFLVPNSPVQEKHGDVVASSAKLGSALRNAELLRLNMGIFSLHAILMAFFVCLPLILESSLDFDRDRHWEFYLPVWLQPSYLCCHLWYLEKNTEKLSPCF